MHVHAIDERDSTDLVDAPTYRVFDWVGDAALAGETTALHAYELTEASLWDALKWAQTNRTPAPSLSEIYACTTDGRVVTLVFLGSIAWHRGDGASHVEHITRRL